VNNQPPKDWNEYFLDQLPGIASKSKDPSTKVGSMTTGEDNGHRTAGFNGFARGVNDNIEEVPERYERPAKYKWTAHAEANAIYYAAKVGIPLNGCTLYVDWHPCCNCAIGIIQSGIAKVVIDGDSKSHNDAVLNERWKEDHEIAATMFREAGVTVVVHKRQ
jgi:dCMP deaminase